MADKQPPPSLKHPPSVKNPPAITLPPRSGIDLFTGGAGASPGPMTLVSSFFAENDPETDCRSFSQLLAVDGGGGATTTSSTVKEYSVTADADSSGGTGGFTFQQRGAQTVSRPQEMVAIPTGMSLSNYLDSGVFFNPSSQAAFGGMNQGVTGNEDSISESQVENKFQAPYPSFSAAAAPNLQQQIAAPMQELKLLKEPYDVSAGADPRQRTSNLVVDKPSDDGYNWRKYGQKQVKGGDFPRSYYKCTHASCPVKKKVERSLDGQITEIIYRGQHNHSPPSKRNRDTGNATAEAVANPQGNSGFRSESLPGGFNKLNGAATYSSSLRDQDPCQATPERLSGSNDSDEVDDSETRANERSSEPESKRRIVEAQGSSHRTVTEPRIVVQTTSEVDLLDDGYRWRKYGQKVVKGNPNPRSYYKCSHPGCSIRKHVERAATDPKAVITTYEGKHNHDAPTSKNSSNMQSLHSRQHSDFK